MISDFNTTDAFEPTSEWIPIDSDSTGRYAFYKVRVYGRLHFVKTLSDCMQGDLISIQALRKEFAIGYNLDHPNIAKYLKFEKNAIFEEYIDGKTLRQMLDEGDERLSDKRFVAAVCRQMLEAVEYMHSQGVLHLDIKPENVMVTRVGSQIKIIDLSCAYSSSDDSTPGYTLQYKAPEQGGENINAYTDIYLVGRLMEMLADNAGITSSWNGFIAKATADDPSERFRTEAEAMRAIPSNRVVIKWWIMAACLIVAALCFYILSVEKTDNSGNGNQTADKPGMLDTVVVNKVDTVSIDRDASSAVDVAVPTKNAFTLEALDTMSNHELARKINEINAENERKAKIIREDTEKMLHQRMRDHYAEYYNKLRHVIVAKIDDTLPKKEWKAKEDVVLDTIGRGMYDLMAYTQDLIAEYPEYESYLLETHRVELRKAQIRAFKLYIKAHPRTDFRVLDE